MRASGPSIALVSQGAVNFDESLLDRARALIVDGRALLGICGAPGAGKSTFAAQLVARLGELAVVVPMDGFHLPDDELVELGLAHRKGAPETFDVTGYVALLRRFRAEVDVAIPAPDFDRHQELSVAGAIVVRPEHRLVVTEGNYLLHDGEGWPEVRPLLDEVWFVQCEKATRVERLVDRHVAHGKTPELARRWTRTSDEANAELVAGTRFRADLEVTAG